MIFGFPGGSVSKESAFNAADHLQAGKAGSIPGSGRSPGEGNGNLLRYFCLGNPMDRGAWWTTVQGGRKRVENNVETENITHTTKWKEFDIFNN